LQEDSDAEGEANDQAAEEVGTGEMALAGESEEEKGSAGEGEAPGVEDRA